MFNKTQNQEAANNSNSGLTLIHETGKKNNLQIFKSPLFGEVRTIGTSENPMFCLSDICKALELTVKGVNQRLGDEVISTYPIIDRLGRTQQALFVNEDGLYDVILDSRKPEAKDFRKWITREVLPALRKTGGYIMAKENDTPEEIMARALVVANETLKRKDERLKRLQSENKEQQKQIAELEKGNSYLRDILQTKDLFATTQIAQDYGMSAKAFNKILESFGIQHKVGGQWILYSRYLNKGYVHSETFSFTDKNGKQHSKMNTKWTQAGRIFLYNLLKEHDVLPLIEKRAA